MVIVVLAATAAFVVGVVVERSHDEQSGGQTAEPAAHSEEGSGHAEGEQAEGTGSHPAAEAGHSESGEKLVGINPESTALLIVAVLTSLALAAAVALQRRSVAIPLVAVLVMLAFAALDIREVVHQIDLSETGIAVLAGLVALLHVTAAATAAVLSKAERATGTA